MSKTSNIFVFIIFFLLALTAGSFQPCLAGSPTEELKVQIESALELFKDPKYKNPDLRLHQREKILAITRQVFDFTEMSKRVLARYWKQFSPQEQKQFVDAFADLLGNTYMDKVEGEYKDETVVFLQEEIISEKKALVISKIQRQTKDIPMEYSMFLSDNKWKVYDVSIEGISLIKNYRTQFDQILAKDTPAQLIDRLQKKMLLKK